MGIRSLVPLAALTLTTAACTASSSGGATTPTAGTTPPTATAVSRSPSPSPTGFTSTCDDALPLSAVSHAAGQPIIGTTAFVVGQPDPSIGRLAYLNCRYGLPTPVPGRPAPKDPEPAIEIGVSLYDSATHAGARVDGTVADYQSSGSRATPLRVGTVNGTALTAPGQPITLVVASGARTVAVTMIGRVFLGNDKVVAIAELALEQVA